VKSHRNLYVLVALLTACLGHVAAEPVTGTPASATVRPASGADRPPAAVVTAPAAGNPQPAREWWMNRPLQIKLAVKGNEQVKAQIIVGNYSGGGLGCTFAGQVKTAIATPRNGIASLGFMGLVVPRPSSRVLESGACKLPLRISRKSGGTWTEVEKLDTVTIQMVAHERVRITATATLRNWLKPNYVGGCLTDDANSQLGITQVAGPLGGDCRADFLTTVNRNGRADWNFNALPEGVIVGPAKWRTEGDANFCSLCADPTSSCPGGDASVTGMPVYYTEDLIGPVITTETSMSGENLAKFTGPPNTPKNGRVTEPWHNVGIGSNDHGDWRSYMYASYARMTCKNWVPTPADAGQALQNAGNAVGNVVGGLGAAAANALGQGGNNSAGNSQPGQILPPAPSIRLVLESWEFYRPRSVRLPFEP
jgi:hypothetical protein